MGHHQRPTTVHRKYTSYVSSIFLTRVQCFRMEKAVMERVVLARFLPNRSLRLPDARHRTQMLEVTPAGQEFLDDILLSALIIERRRRRPTRHTDMFN